MRFIDRVVAKGYLVVVKLTPEDMGALSEELAQTTLRSNTVENNGTRAP